MGGSNTTGNISTSIDRLKANLSNVARVEEWARLMGYKSPKKFSRKFLRHHSVRPQKMMEFIRLKSIIRQLRDRKASNFEIARTHGIPDEKALNKFTNYHLGCSPTELKTMPNSRLKQELEILGSKVR